MVIYDFLKSKQLSIRYLNLHFSKFFDCNGLFTLAETDREDSKTQLFTFRTRISTLSFCIGQESESDSIPVSEFGNMFKP